MVAWGSTYAQFHGKTMQAKTELIKVKINGKTVFMPRNSLMSEKAYEKKRKDMARIEKSIKNKNSMQKEQEIIAHVKAQNPTLYEWTADPLILYVWDLIVKEAAPPLKERKKVYAYLLSLGYSLIEAERFDPFSRDYTVALQGMKYQELVRKNKV